MEEKRSPALPERKGPEIRYTGKKKHNPLKWARILLCLAGILTAAAGLCAEISLRPKMAALARAETLRQLSLLTARATAEFAAAGEMDYRDLVKMEFDPAGRLMAVRCDTGALNALSARMVCRVEEELERQGAFSVRVPLGTLFGGFLFAGKGVPVRVRIVPVGGVTGRIHLPLYRWICIST